MTFQDVLSRVVDDTPGAIAAAIMGGDGIPVDEYSADDLEGSGEILDLPSVAVEFQRVVEDARKVTGALYEENGGDLEEIVLITTNHQLLFRQVDDEYFVVVALHPTGMLGKARYRIRTLLDELREEL